jgi:hypothetical protein
MSQQMRWLAPPDGPTAKSEHLSQWAVGELAGEPGMIYANARDLDALRSTLLAERVTLPERGIVQPGTVWVEVV